ncbi:MAG: response regulator transcription factor [Chloroflexota bacterium]
MTEKVQIGILEDHIATATGYKALLEANEQLQIRWSAQYYNEVESSLEAHPTDVLILDVGVDNSPIDPNPFPILHIIPRLLEKYPEMAILIISMYDRRALIKATQHAGAIGYILKDDFESFEKLDEIILEIAEGGIYYSPEVEQRLSRNGQSTPRLTKRQSEILSYIASSPNMTTGQLAEQLNLAPSTIRNHLSDAYIRLGVNRLNSAIAKARKLGLITPEN